MRRRGSRRGGLAGRSDLIIFYRTYFRPRGTSGKSAKVAARRGGRGDKGRRERRGSANRWRRPRVAGGLALVGVGGGSDGGCWW